MMYTISLFLFWKILTKLKYTLDSLGGPESHTPAPRSRRESGQTPIPVLFMRSVLTKQQRTALIKNCVTGRHESVEIVRTKRCLFENLDHVLIIICREVFDDVPTSSAHAIHHFHGFPELSRSVRVWPVRDYTLDALGSSHKILKEKQRF